MVEAVIIMGSARDQGHVDKITAALQKLDIPWQTHVASAHKNPRQVLEILEAHAQRRDLVYITVAGRSNALSGFVAANSLAPTLACPPFQDKLDMLVNIHSTLQMPSQTPVLTILDPENCALAVQRILSLGTRD